MMRLGFIFLALTVISNCQPINQAYSKVTDYNAEMDKKFPFAAYIVNENQTMLCNGVLIDQFHVLTSVGCFDLIKSSTGNSYIDFGTDNLWKEINDMASGSNQTKIKMSFEIPYTGLAVITVERAIEIFAIPLAQSDKNSWNSCKIIAWKSNAESLSQVELTSNVVFDIPYDFCNGTSEPLKENVLCFGYQNDSDFYLVFNKSDSGAGIICEENGLTVLVGIVSGKDIPGYVESVPYYKQVLDLYAANPMTTTVSPTTIITTFPTKKTKPTSSTKTTTTGAPTSRCTTPRTNPTVKTTEPTSSRPPSTTNPTSKPTTKPTSSGPPSTTNTNSNSPLTKAANYILIGGIAVGVPVISLIIFMLVKLFYK